MKIKKYNKYINNYYFKNNFSSLGSNIISSRTSLLNASFIVNIYGIALFTQSLNDNKDCSFLIKSIQ